MFVAQWNGIGLAPSVCVRSMPPLYTDASGSWGCGVSWNQHWFQLKWDERSQSLPITVKEMLPIVISAAIRGPQWRVAKQVACCCDNAAVVAALSSRSCKVDHIMHLMRCLFYVEAYHEFTLHCTHLPGSLNTVADALSRNALPSFRLQMQEADPLPYAPTQADRRPAAQGPRLAVSDLEGTLRFYYAQGLAESTHRTYQSGMRHLLYSLPFPSL